MHDVVIIIYQLFLHYENFVPKQEKNKTMFFSLFLEKNWEKNKAFPSPANN